MSNILLTISYDGTDFCGWQRQDNPSGKESVRTVQGEIEKALSVIHKEPVALSGSGRTDSGVHAFGQAANFFSPIESIPVKNYVVALNGLLPHDIRIMSAQKVSDSFHARFSATSRTYRYFIHCGATPSASEMRYVYSIKRYPDISVLNRMASCLHGEIDCTTFSASGDMSLSKKRYIEKAVFWMDGSSLVFEISANAFLWRMVRSITGSLLYYEQKGMDAEKVYEILESKDRKLAGPTAPSQGLFLWNVKFDGIRRH